MFCPRCGAQNKIESRYCRECGLPLTSVRLTLEGRVDEAAARLEKVEGSLTDGAATLGIFVFIALINFFFDSSKNWLVFINLILGLLIAGPMIYKGAKRLEWTRKLMDGKEQLRPLDAEPPLHSAVFSPSIPDTDPLQAKPLISGSVTEHTTLNLKQSGTGRKLRE
jgi:hypothetical protein